MILEISQADYISATADSFLIDRQARALSRHHSSSIESSCGATFSRLEKNIIPRRIYDNWKFKGAPKLGLL